MAEEKDIRETTIFDAWPQGPLGLTLLTTYTFDPFFFEFQLLPELLLRDAHPIVVFADHSSGYAIAEQSATELRRLGRDYYLLPVRVSKGVFHPKVHFFDGAGVAVVGSGNLTSHGCGGNLEILDVLSAQHEAEAVDDVRRFFAELARRHAAPAPSNLRDRIEAIEPKAGTASDSADVRFIHTLTQGLWPQLEDDLRTMSGADLLLAAPFHDSNHFTSSRITKMIDPASCRIASDKKHGAPSMEDSKTEQGYLVQPEGAKRTLHAKLLQARNTKRELLISGSANLTNAAWSGNNVEAVVCRWIDRTNEAGTHFDPNLAFVPGEWPVDHQPEPEPNSSDDALPWSLGMAVLEGETLRIPIEGEVENPVFHLLAGDSLTSLDLLATEEGVWTGTIPDIPTGTAVAEIVDRHGNRRRSIVLQLDILKTPPARRRRIAALLAAGSHDASYQDRIEMIQVLYEWICDPTDSPKLANAAIKGASASQKPGDPSTDNEGPSVAIQSALEISRRTVGDDGDAHSLNWLFKRIADTVSGFVDLNRDELEIEGMEPPSNEEDHRGSKKKSKAARAAIRKQENTINSRVLDLLKTVLRSDATDSGPARDRFPTAYTHLLRTVTGRMCRLAQVEDTGDLDFEQSQSDLLEFGRTTFSLLKKAWLVPVWGRNDSPGLLIGASNRPSSEILEIARVALAKAVNLLREDVAQGSSLEDSAWCVLAGIDGLATRSTSPVETDPDHPVFQWHPDCETSDILKSIGEHKLDAEAAYTALQYLRELVEHVDGRGSSGLSAVDPDELKRMEQAFYTEQGSHGRRKIWKHALSYFDRDGKWPIHARNGAACPNCSGRLPSGMTSRLNKPWEYVLCENCGHIILPGPLFRDEESS